MTSLAETIVELTERIRVLESQTAVDETAMLQLIDERDVAEDWADRLAAALAPTDAIGEHSSSNNPWYNALEYAEVNR